MKGKDNGAVKSEVCVPRGRKKLVPLVYRSTTQQVDTFVAIAALYLPFITCHKAARRDLYVSAAEVL